MIMNYKLSGEESRKIDFLRAVSFIMVMYLHQYVGKMDYTDVVIELNRAVFLESFEYIVSRIITFSAVPLFFLMSAVLLYAKNFTWQSNMKKKMKTLVLPYILWISIYIAIYAVGQALPFTAIYFANAGRQIADFTIWDFVGAYIGYFGEGLFVNSMWFIHDLIIFNVLACVIKRIVDKFPILIFGCVLILWLFAPTKVLLGINVQGICFFTLGYYVVKYDLRMSALKTNWIWQILFLYVFAIGFKYYLYLRNNSLVSPAHGIAIILGIALLIQISHIICEGDKKLPQLLSLVAQNSFFIYAAHDFIQTVLKKVSGKLFIQTDFVQGIEFIVVPALTCLICLSGALIIKKILPGTYGILTGGRKQIG